MDRFAERHERDLICRAALAMWLQAGAPAGRLMSYLPAAEARIRTRSAARDAPNSCDDFNRSMAAETGPDRRFHTAMREPAPAARRAKLAAPPG